MPFFNKRQLAVLHNTQQHNTKSLVKYNFLSSVHFDLMHTSMRLSPIEINWICF